MANNSATLKEEYNEELKKFINGLRGLQTKEAVANEEKGVSIIKFVKYFVTWDEDNKVPKAPLFLSNISIKKSGKYKLSISNEFEINQVLIEYFKNEKAILPSKELEEKFISETININQFDEAIDLFEKHYLSEGVRGLKIEDSSMIGYFDYSNLPMVADLSSEEFEELVSEHELGEAIATVDSSKIDEEVKKQYRVSFPEYEEIDQIIPSKEFLILDADSSQQLPILAAGKGFHLVVQGPPGTGKSQTIANMISYCASLDEPKKILFVSEKRAAIDAVLKRLNEKNLDFLTLDVFKGLKPSNKREIYDELSKLLESGLNIYDNSAGRTLDSMLPEVRKKLNDIVKETGTNNFDKLNQFTSHSKTTFIDGLREYESLLMNIDNLEIESLIENIDLSKTVETADKQIETIVSSVKKRERIIGEHKSDIEMLEEYILLNKNFQKLENYEYLYEQFEIISKLTEPEYLKLFDKFNSLFNLELKDFKTINELISIAIELNKVLNIFSSDIFNEDIEDLINDIDQYQKVNNKNAEAKLKDSKEKLFSKLKYFQLRKVFIRKKTLESNARNVVKAKNILNKYKFDFSKINELSITSAEIDSVFGELKSCREIIEKNTNIKFDEFKSIEQLVSILKKILNSPIFGVLNDLSKEYKILNEFNFNHYRILDKGNSKNLEFITKAILIKTTLNKIFKENFIELSEIRNETISAFKNLDGDERVAQNIEQIKLKYTHNLNAAKLKFPDQLNKIRREANKKRRQANFRKILEEAQDMMLGVKPCWVMSPLVASQVLPRRQLFDLVIFDEASQVQTSSAITAIARGKKLVVAGDSQQLPPTDFFKTQLDEEFVTETQDFESILQIMDSIMEPSGNQQLQFHYRSKDERLITTSNKCMDYGLNTIPGITKLDSINFIKVETEVDSKEGSNPEEVEIVCNEISEHMKNYPDKSLVVITFGAIHMRKIEELFYKKYENLSHVSKYIEYWEDTIEPFRIKNLETVQGDERDFVILSVGYGKKEGRLNYQFGPINRETGNRRLNVAASRAKEAMTIISSISHEDLLDSKMKSKGLKMFKTLLAYFELESNAPTEQKGIAGLKAFDNTQIEKPLMNPIEQQIKRAIERLGYIVEPQYGVSGYFIDFVIADKSKPGKWLLAVEFDGARYHSSRTARDRDRLRQRNLENSGWKFFRIWSTDWFNDKNKVLKNLENELKKLI